MLLAGDEFGRTQKGNNNGYCQDSEISWINWEGLSENDEKLRDFTRRLIALRAEQPLLRRENWRDGLEIRWFNAGGDRSSRNSGTRVPLLVLPSAVLILSRKRASGTTC